MKRVSTVKTKKRKAGQAAERFFFLTDPPACAAVLVVTVGPDFDGSSVAGGIDLISQTAASWGERGGESERERVSVLQGCALFSSL